MKELLKRFTEVHLLVIGDLMIDLYLGGSVDRVSPEAPVPILKVDHERRVLGGAANVAANVKGLGAEVTLAGIAGNDFEGGSLDSLLRSGGIDPAGILWSETRPTTVKTRLIAQHHQLARFDREVSEQADGAEANSLWKIVEPLIESTDGIVVSDYAKGTVSDEFLARLITKTNQAGKRLYVDPKGSDYSRYSGASVLTPNEKEAYEAARYAGFKGKSPSEIGRHLLNSLELDALLVTLGEKGMELFENGREPQRLEAQERKVFDVTGAGDTVIAALATAHAAGADLFSAASVANLAAGIVVERLGTSSISVEELETALSNLTPEGREATIQG